MWMAFSKTIDGGWIPVTNMGMPFLAEEGLMDYMLEKMQLKHPTVEFQKRKLQ